MELMSKDSRVVTLSHSQVRMERITSPRNYNANSKIRGELLPQVNVWPYAHHKSYKN